MNPQSAPQLTPLQQQAASRKLLEAEVLSQAWTDEVFYQKLQSDPASALSEIGLTPPAGKAIQILTEETDTITLVIPPKPTPSDEAGDAELEAVAGGGLLQDGKCKLYKQVSGEQSINTSENNAKPLTGAGALIARGTLAGFAGALAFTGLSWGWG